MSHEFAGVLQGERLDIDDLCGQAGGLDGGLALFDVLGPGGDEQHVVRVRVLLRRTEHLEVVAHFVHRKGDVLVGLHLHLRFQIAGA